MKGLNYIALLLLATSCQKFNPNEVNNLNNGKIDVLGHGGLGFDNPFQQRPFNSWDALSYVIENTSSNGVEVDVQITSDSMAMVFHDAALEHSTTCGGCLPNKAFDELDECRYITAFTNGEHPLVRLDELLSFHDGDDFAPIILLDSKTAFSCLDEAQSEAHLERLALAYWQLISVPQRQDRVWVISSNTFLIEKIQMLDPAIRIYLGSSIFPMDIERATALNCHGILSSNDAIDSQDVQTAHDAGLQVCTFNIGSRDEHIDAIEKHPDHIITDNLHLALDLLR